MKSRPSLLDVTSAEDLLGRTPRFDMAGFKEIILGNLDGA